MTGKLTIFFAFPAASEEGEQKTETPTTEIDIVAEFTPSKWPFLSSYMFPLLLHFKCIQ